MNPATGKCILVVTLVAASVPSLARAGCGGKRRVARPAAASSSFQSAVQPTAYYPAQAAAHSVRQPALSHHRYKPLPTQRMAPVTQSQVVLTQPIQSSVRPAQAAIANSVAAPSTRRPKTQSNRRESKPVVTRSESETINSSEASALSMLASLIEQAPESPSDRPSVRLTAARRPEPHVGEWKTTLPNHVLIHLTLEPAGEFSWTVDNQGRTIELHGRYRLRNERLTLVREGDQQEIAGRFVKTDFGFEFVLDEDAQRLRFERR